MKTEKTLNFKRLISAMLYALLCLLMTSAFIFCAITPAFAADTKVATTGQELQALIDNVSEGGELHIQLDPSGKGEFAYDFIIDKTIEITKPCKLYFDGLRQVNQYGVMLLRIKCNSSHTFHVDADNVELHFSSAVQIGGPQNNKVHGEGIYVDGYNCLIDGGYYYCCGDPMRRSYSGGAIYVNNENCTIQDAMFENCYGHDGGAICVDDDYCHIIDCRFRYCYADYGGAIYVCSYNGDGFVASGCTFEDGVHAEKYPQYIYGSSGAQVFNCDPHWGDEGYYYGVEFVTSDPLGFTLSGGNWWIIGVGTAVILGGIAAIVIVNRKKKKTV